MSCKTCVLGADQIFDTERFADWILFMLEYDVCAMLTGTDAGREVTLAACDASAEQGFVFFDEGMITQASTSASTPTPPMCLMLG